MNHLFDAVRYRREVHVLKYCTWCVGSQVTGMNYLHLGNTFIYQWHKLVREMNFYEYNVRGHPKFFKSLIYILSVGKGTFLTYVVAPVSRLDGINIFYAGKGRGS